MTIADDAWDTFKVQHDGKPMTEGFVRAFYGPLDGVAGTAADLIALRGVETATGAQLDGVGQIVGISRSIPLPLVGVYFSLDVVGLGLDEAVWRGRYDTETGLFFLDDDTYRILIRAKIAANAWDGTRDGAQRALEPVFAAIGTTILVEDRQDMSMTIQVQGIIPIQLYRVLLTQGYLTFKPLGVGQTLSYRVPSVPGAPIFALNVSNATYAGLDVGNWSIPA